MDGTTIIDLTKRNPPVCFLQTSKLWTVPFTLDEGGPSFVALYCEQCEDHSSSKVQAEYG